MRRKRSPRSPIGVVIALCAAVLLCASGAGAQTLVNGNFEGGNTNGVGTGWTSYLESGATGAWVVHTGAPVPEGAYYQQVQITTASKYGGVRQTVTGCTPCTTYNVTGYMRTNSTSATSTVLVDPAGGTSRAAATPLSAGTTSTAWVTFSGTVTPSGTTFTIFLDVAVTTVSKAGAFDAIVVAPCSAPAVPTSVSANPTTVCGGASSTLSASVTSGCTVDWYAGSCCGTLVGSGTTLVVNPTSTTTYYPRARNTSTGCGSSGCGSSVTVTATASPAAPTGVAANPSSVSPGGSSTLTASVTAGCTVDWYTGSCGGTLVGTGTSITVSPSVTTTYYVRWENACGNSTCATTSVTVNALPSAPTSPAANPSSITSGQSSTLSASVASGCTVDWYTGSCGGTLVGSGTSLVVSPTSTTTYYPRARNTTTGCVSSACGSSVTVTVTAAPVTLLNGSFETDSNSDGVPDYWTTYIQSGGTAAFTRQTASPPSGGGTYYQQTQVTTANKYAGVRQTVTGCTIGATYTIAGYYRTNSTSATVSVRVDPAGGTTRPSTALCSTTNNAFTAFSGNVVATGTSMTIFLDAAITTVSKAGCFDAITVTAQ